jgi:transcriptional regulator with XRE-family HTH domain
MAKGMFPLPGLGQRVYHRRKQLGWTLADLEDKAGLGTGGAGVISRLEHGVTKDPSIGLCVRLAEALGMTLDALAYEARGADRPYVQIQPKPKARKQAA